MTGQNTDKSTEKQPEQQQQQQSAGDPATERARHGRPLAGFLIAGASLALLFGIAALKGRVKDDN